VAFDGTLKFDTAIDKAGFNAGLSGLGDLAKSGLSGIGSIAKAGMAAVTGAVTAASGAVMALGKSAVSVGSSFESGMSQVIATMGITKDTIQDGVNSYDLLSKAAQDAGANTTFSATEAAGALNYLALAGYDAATAADSLDAVLNLAAAGSLDLQYAADLATDAMAALGIEASKDNLTHFGDQMAVTASKSNTSVAQLGEAILTVGGTAKSLSGGVTEMNAALGVLANRGIKGAEGGTALRNMILSLTAPTDKAAAKLEELGVKVLDESGNMRSLNDVFRDLDKALSGVADGEKTQILNDIFNKVDLKSAQAMLAGCGEEFNSLSSAIDSCDGAMQKMADTMNDTLEGDMKALNSRAEALGIAVYESINEPLRELAQLGGDYLKQLKDAFDVGGFSGAADAVGGILGDAVTVLGGYLPDVAGIGNRIVSSLLTGITENSGTIIQTGIDMGLTMLSGFGDITVNFLELGGSLLASLAEGIDKKKLRIRRIMRETLRHILEAVQDNLPVMLEAGGEILDVLGGAILDNLELLLGIGSAVVSSLVNAIADPDGLEQLTTGAVEILTVLLTALTNPESLGTLLEAALQIVTALGTGIMDSVPLLLGAAVQIILSLVQGLADPENLNALLGTALLIIMTLLTALTDNVDTLVGAAVTIVETLGVFLAEHADELIETGLELLTKILDGIFEHTDDIFLAAETIITALYDELCNEETMAKIFDLGYKLLMKLLSGLLNFTGEAVGFLLTMTNRIQNRLLSVNWFQLGKDILKSILDGMASIDLGMLNDFKDNWIDGMKMIFKINSPSKLMEDEIGKNLALGIEVGFDENLPDPGDALDAFGDLDFDMPSVNVPVAWETPSEMPSVSVPVAWETQPLPDPGEVTVSLTDDAVRVLEALRSVQIPVRTETDTAVLEALRTSPLPDASALVPQSATSVVNNSYYSTVNTTTSNQTTNNNTAENHAASGNIVIPVQIGEEKIETIVLSAIELANARSGGGTI